MQASSHHSSEAFSTRQIGKSRLLGGPAFAWILAILLASGCATGPMKQPAPEQAQALEEARMLLESDPASAARQFEDIANDMRDEPRQQALLSAADAWLQAGHVSDAKRVLSQLDTLDSPLLRQRKTLLSAELDLNDQQPRKALERLEGMTTVAESLQADVIRLQARALFQLGATAEATRLLDQQIRRESTRSAQRESALLVWRGLSRSREPLTDNALPPGSSPALKAWFELGRLGQLAWQEPYRFEQRLRDWQQRYPQHPAAQLAIDDILTAHERRFEYPERIALLLPLEGRFGSSAEAVRDGLLAAYYEHINHRDAPRLIIRNTGGTAAGAAQAARSAMTDGARFIIGPLTKEGLAAVDAEKLGIPVLGLNYLDSEAQVDAGDNITQFGLLPEDEAIQVAERTIAECHKRAIALVPDSDFGLRLLAAFRSRFEELGGDVLTVQRFRSGQTDFSTPIMRALNIDDSRLREQQLRSIIGLPLEFEPRRRQDVEFVFLGAHTDEARQIKPQLRFHQGIGLPVYATSHVYEPDMGTDRDLDEIRFTDMPWVLAAGDNGAATQRQLKSLWPDEFSRSARLYALGYDAFRLVPLIAGNDPALQQPLPAMTGLLSIDEFGRIRRDLYWAKFENGKPQLLPDVTRTAEDGASLTNDITRDITRNVKDGDMAEGSR